MSFFLTHAVDIVIIAAIGFYCWGGWRRGAVAAVLDVIGFVASLVVAQLAYVPLGIFLASRFPLAAVTADAIAFMVLWIAVEAVYPFAANAVYRALPARFQEFRGHRPVGALVAAAGGGLLVAIILSTAIAMPFPSSVKKWIGRATFGEPLLRLATSFGTAFPQVFGNAGRETLSLFTVEPESSQTVELRFTTDDFSVAEDAERELVSLTNSERVKAGLPVLRVDAELTALARAHGADMLRRGYFSHFTPEGDSPSDRADNAGISYAYFGENLAYAPDVKLAHQGLMASSGHRANILSQAYSRVGIGVQDAGSYGFMIVEEFAR